MRADAEDGFARVATSWTKQDLRHVLDDKPPLRFGDDAEDSLSNRRVIKKPRFLMRGDTKCLALGRYGFQNDCVSAHFACCSMLCVY